MNDTTETDEATVLLVEDSDIDAMLLRRTLARLRPRVRVVRGIDGTDALEKLAGPDGCRPDLILMDIRMPRMDGREALRQIKEDERLKRIPVIMMSTSRNESDVSFCYHNHANAYVVKSLDAREGKTVENLVRFWLDTAEL